jgi:hypothetical protein
MIFEDQEKLRRWRMLPEVTKYLLTDPIITLEQQIKWYNGVKDGKKYKCWIIQSDGIDIGFVNLAEFDEVNKHADPGVFICESEFRGKGLAKFILMNLMEHAFEYLKLKKLYGPILSENAAAVASYLKSGFQIEGFFRNHLYKNDRFWDLVYVAIFDFTWIELKKKIQYEKGFFEAY